MYEAILIMLLGYTPLQDKQEKRQHEFPEMDTTDSSAYIKGEWKL